MDAGRKISSKPFPGIKPGGPGKPGIGGGGIKPGGPGKPGIGGGGIVPGNPGKPGIGGGGIVPGNPGKPGIGGGGIIKPGGPDWSDKPLLPGFPGNVRPTESVSLSPEASKPEAPVSNDLLQGLNENFGF